MNKSNFLMNMDIVLINILILLISYFMMSMMLILPKKMFTNNPLMMSLILWLLTLLYSLNLSLFVSSFWFSMIMFLMIIGGLLILFLYFTSISPNEFMNFNSKSMISFLLKIIISLFIIFIINKFINNNFNFINLWKNSNEFNYMINKMNYNFSSNFIYNNPIYKITLFMILYLFYTLFIINKLCLNTKKPMRKFNN